ncbi:MAG: hypothetical protein QW356_09220 [Candidatus Hadarchaeales archaeon]
MEREARKIGGASTKEQIEKLKPKIHEIDKAVAKILGSRMKPRGGLNELRGKRIHGKLASVEFI